MEDLALYRRIDDQMHIESPVQRALYTQLDTGEDLLVRQLIRVLAHIVGHRQVTIECPVVHNYEDIRFGILQ
ncbi:hypothetical protein CAI18_23395 (plasmid) [Xanthomonas citri pv. punicae]|nr:hypothetical protein CAI14_23685 [Xanthomonas citri pv. punicae]QCZ71369.1 hypothetical protein CAI17_22955 [Xanthomonas citri pv. punicae]QCZ79547.1 hypothetical protein XapA_23140 [Xanthomonas citri pv. punicae]QCZ79635.1 hypothetical protein XapA_23910 [Xanthomonas citri pv. punicae]QCZ83715.1 hypothetical protein XapB_23685 [Xanthomonas citri pv. punicae]